MRAIEALGRWRQAISVFLLSLLMQGGRAQNMDSVLVSLDSCIAQRWMYGERYTKALDSLRTEAEQAVDTRTAVSLWTQVEVKAFRYRSEYAIDVLNKACSAARKAGDKQAEYRFIIRKAAVYGMLGIPWEAESLLDSCLDRDDISSFWRKEAYVTYYDSYEAFRRNILPREISERKQDEIRPIEYALKQMGQDPKQAAFTFERSSYSVPYMIDVLEQNYENNNEIGKAVTAIVLADKYALLRDDKNRDYYLALSAIYSIRAAQYELPALARLAKRLFETGDTERAIRYALVAYEHAEAYGVSQYKIEAADVLKSGLEQKVIEGLSTRKSARLWQGIALLLIVLMVFFLVWYGWHHRKMSKLRAALEAERAKEQEYIEMLKSHVEVKDEYVTRFLVLSLDAVYEVEQLRRLTLMRLKAGESDRLKKALTDPARFEAFQKECLQRFDLAFLRLYPEFARQVNRLLLPNEQIELSDTQLMNNELRILAFMKLGVSDGSKIATILGISVNTLYFYRNRLRRRAVDRDTFENSIMQL